MISTNGTDWTVVPDAYTNLFGNPTPLFLASAIDDITFLNGTYYAIGRLTPMVFPGVAISDDLVNWSVSDSMEFHTIAAGNGAIVACNAPFGFDYFFLSGATWNRIADFKTFVFSQKRTSEITFQNGQFLTIRYGVFWPFGAGQNGNAKVLSYSSDGVNWANAMAVGGPVNNIDSRSAAGGGGYYVFPAGGSIYYSTTLSPISEGTGNWTEVNLNIASPQGAFSDVAFGNGVFVATTLGKIYRSGLLTGADSIHIAMQPASVTVLAGATTTLRVIAQGSDPITYQWRHEGTNLVGQTFNTLTLSNITTSVAGRYDVQVTNGAGTVPSQPADVTVNFAQMLLYSGVTLYGKIGDRFLVEYQDSLNPSSPWNNLATVMLSSTNYIYIDYDSASLSNRYYRATFQP